METTRGLNIGGDSPTALPYALPDFLSSLLALANFILLKAAHVGVGECSEAGNPGSLRSG